MSGIAKLQTRYEGGVKITRVTSYPKNKYSKAYQEAKEKLEYQSSHPKSEIQKIDHGQHTIKV